MSGPSETTTGQGASSIALFDNRAFFEKALLFGMQHGILDATKLDSIQTDAPKGMVQIARYFGSEFLRPELEKAHDRIINMVSLSLEIESAGDVAVAAKILRENTFMSRSKAASDMLKALIVMPQNSHFGMNELGSFSDKHIPQLAKWSLCSLAEYQSELAKRLAVVQLIEAAQWLADSLGLDSDDLHDAGPDAEAVIRTAILVRQTSSAKMPDWVAFQQLIAGLRKKNAVKPLQLSLPKTLPSAYKPVVEHVLETVKMDLPKILDDALTPQKLFNQTPAFVGRYFWIEDSLAQVDHFDREASALWNKVTKGHSDDSSLLTLFLCIAAGVSGKTLLTEKSASALIRKIRKSGLQPLLASQFIQDHAPIQYQTDYLTLWNHFIEDAQATLQSDRDYKLHDALALLRNDCNISQ
jgi:hypothetical protein